MRQIGFACQLLNECGIGKELRELHPERGDFDEMLGECKAYLKSAISMFDELMKDIGIKSG